MILKNKLCGSAARLGRGFQTRPFMGRKESNQTKQNRMHCVVGGVGMSGFVIRSYSFSFLILYTAIRPQGHSRQVGAASVSTRQ